MVNALECPGVVGDGRHDDSAGLQAALDTKAATVHLPRPSGHYLIRQTLVVDSGQTLIADRNAIIRLGDHAHCHMLTNANHDQESCGITVTGGIWDGNNVHQTCEYHENGGKWQVPYDFNVVSFTNHRVHPGSPSTFDDISIDSVFCSKSAKGMNLPSGGRSGPAYRPSGLMRLRTCPLSRCTTTTAPSRRFRPRISSLSRGRASSTWP